MNRIFQGPEEAEAGVRPASSRGPRQQNCGGVPGDPHAHEGLRLGDGYPGCQSRQLRQVPPPLPPLPNLGPKTYFREAVAYSGPR